MLSFVGRNVVMAVKLKDLLNFDIKPFLFGVLFSRIVSDEKRNTGRIICLYGI